MKLFFQKYLWLVIALIGGSLLLIQNRTKNELEEKLSQSAKTTPVVSHRRIHHVTPNDIPDAEAVSVLYKKTKKEFPKKHHSEFLRELSSFSSQDLADLRTSLHLQKNDRSTMSLRDMLRTLHRIFDPNGALNFENSLHKQIIRIPSATLQSPAEVENWISRNDLGEKLELFEEEFRRHRLLREPGSHPDDWNPFYPDPSEAPLLSADTLDELAEVIDLPEYIESRSTMITSLLVSSALEDFSSAKLQAENLNLTPEDLFPVFSKFEDLGMGSPELLEWSLQVPEASYESRQDALFANFAVRDLDGAANWLNGIDLPSKTKDVLHSRYAGIVSRVDPDEGLAWAEKIKSPETRERVKGRIRATYE